MTASSESLAAKVGPAPGTVRATVIAPGQGRWREPLREAAAAPWAVVHFGRRGLEKTYQRTLLGPVWLFLRPAVDLVLRVLVLGGVLGASGGRVPYLLFAMIGLSTWQLFETVAYWATRSLEINRRVLRRLHLPWLAVLLSALGPGGFYFVLYSIVTLAVAGWYGVTDGTTYLAFGLQTLLLPVGIAMTTATALVFGLVLARASVRVRDVRFGMAYAVGFWMFLTPVLYPVEHLTGAMHAVALANPVTAPVELVKDALIATGGPQPESLVATAIWLLALGWVGLRGIAEQESEAMERA